MVDRVEDSGPQEVRRPEPTPIELFDQILTNPMAEPYDENRFFADLNTLSRVGGTQLPEVTSYFEGLRSDRKFAETFGKIRFWLMDNIITYADAIAGDPGNREARKALQEGLSSAKLLGLYEEPETAAFLIGIQIPGEPEALPTEALPLDEDNKVVQVVRRLEAFDIAHKDMDLSWNQEEGDKRLIIEEGIILNISELNLAQLEPDRLLSLLSPDTQAQILALVKLQGDSVPQIWINILQEYERYGYVSNRSDSSEIETDLLEERLEADRAKQLFLDLVKDKTLVEKLNFGMTSNEFDQLVGINLANNLERLHSSVLWDTDLTTIVPTDLGGVYISSDMRGVIAAKVKLMGDKAPQSWKDYVASSQDRINPERVDKLFFGGKLDQYREAYSRGEDVTALEEELLQFILPTEDSPNELQVYYPEQSKIPLHLLKLIRQRLTNIGWKRSEVVTAGQHLTTLHANKSGEISRAIEGRQVVNAIREAKTPEQLCQAGKKFRFSNFTHPSFDRKLSDLWGLQGDESYFGVEKYEYQDWGNFVDPVWSVRRDWESGRLEEEEPMIEKYFSGCSADVQRLINTYIQIARNTPYSISAALNFDHAALERAFLTDVGMDPNNYQEIESQAKLAANEWATAFYYSPPPMEQLREIFKLRNVLGGRFYQKQVEYKQKRHELDKKLQQQSGLKNTYVPAKRGYSLVPIASTSS